MSDYLLLYLFTRLDAIHNLAIALAIGGGIAAVMAALFSWGKEDFAEIWADRPDSNEYKHRMSMAAALKKKIRPCAAFAFVCAMAVVAVPSKSDMAIIVGGKIALDVGRSETAQEIGQEVLDAIRAQLREAKQ